MTLRTLLFTFLLGATIATLAYAATALPRSEVGQKAPEFTLTGADGRGHSLSDYAGKVVVLEWTNPNCPFVHKFYSIGAMQRYQAAAVAKGVVWLRINSSAPGHDGAQTTAELTQYDQENKVAATASLLDPQGTVGHLYGATNTPEMFVINPKGKLVYAGGIDDHPTPDVADVPISKNYVNGAIADVLAGQPVEPATARPYGCSVKYAE